ncbi:MAG: hypothetical protein D6706_21670, partial [Chloroflexi bacterium]
SAARRWAVKGGGAVLDQGLFSAANFLVNILLARWLVPKEYGAFTVALSVFYLLASLHTAVLTEPMMVFGAGKYRARLHKYFRLLMWGHWGISAVMFFVLGAGALVLRSVPLSRALLGLAIATPFLLLLWFARRATYVELRPQWAVVGSGVNLLCLIAGLSVVYKFGRVSVFVALLTQAVAALVSSLVVIAALNLHQYGDQGLRFNNVLADHWSFGKWNVLSTLMYVMSGQVVFFLVPIYLGLENSAVIASILNIYRPVLLALNSLANILMVVFARSANQSDDLVPKRVFHAAALFGGGISLYAVVVSGFSDQIFWFVYNGKYIEHKFLLPVFGLMYSCSAITVVLLTFLKSSGRVRTVVPIYGVGVVLLVVTCVPFMVFAGVFGAALSMLLSYVATLVCAVAVIINLADK